MAITVKTNKGKRVAAMVTYTVPGMKSDAAERVVKLLQDRLDAGPSGRAVRAMADETAERIAALGGSPCGTPGALVATKKR